MRFDTVPEKLLRVKRSQIPNAGKGLYTTVAIPAGELVIEYKGIVCTWKEVKDQVDNDYIYYFNARQVINAKPHTSALARYANDAEGYTKIDGLRNNCRYKKFGKRVFIKAVVNIPAGAEIFVSYGKDYWRQAAVNADAE